MARERLVLLRAGIERARQLIEQIIALVMLRTNTLQETPVDVSQMARELIAQYLPNAEALGIDLGLEETQRLTISGHPDNLWMILKNALENALRHTPHQGEITLRLLADEEYAIVEVVDTGPGIPAAERERVFDLFYRIAASRDNGGSGLGLNIAREAAARLGGTVSLHDRPEGTGLVFRYRQRRIAGKPDQCPETSTPPLPSGSQDQRPEPTTPAVSRSRAIEALPEHVPSLPPLPPVTIWHRLAPYVLAILLTTATFFLRQFLALSLNEQFLLTLLLFMIPIIVSAVLGGFGPGLTATLVAAADMAYAMPPDDSFAIEAETDLAQWVVFVINSFLVSVLSEVVHRVRQQETEQWRQLAATQEQLLQSEVRFQATFEQAAMGMALVTPDGHWFKVNHKLCEIVGYPQEELLTRTIQDITYPPDRDIDRYYLHQVLTGESRSYSTEKRYIRKDGRLVWINATLALVRKPDATPDYLVAIKEDITEKKRLGEELNRYRQHLEELVTQRTTELSAAEARNDILRQTRIAMEAAWTRAENLLHESSESSEESNPSPSPGRGGSEAELYRHPVKENNGSQ